MSADTIAKEKIERAKIRVEASGIDQTRRDELLDLLDHAEHISNGGGKSIEDIAKAAGVSRRTLQLRYRSVLGRTVHEDLAQTRLNTARKLILETNLPIKEIALRTGFQNSIYLSKVFRRELDITPASLRRQPVRTI